ncbi:serine/threonine-protein kinase [Scleromatobacter humisilvae]|uniref:non-specific serine/threonine protein kinase n=1 Tax=Scleromatobacter humisilvae TaxID=2897159 RepID=A0A9X1YH46_9BURK|nr:serine/threonine-protein kinase [Scleromatobacter humisilvae]MCK9685632.1 protein kinase [Scleromatobacter humisilvae]
MATTAPIPERIGKYTISEVLGRGSMGTVYKAFDPHIHRPVAIKTIHRELLGDSTAADSIAARFRNEAKAVGRIAHPGVVAIYDFGEDGDVTFIAMEYVDGRTLDEILAVPQMLSEANVLAVMDQLLDALSVAHAQGVWHRDIKPANLIVTKAGQVKLTDFGIARLEDANLTQVSSMIGTPAYMAPEQFTGQGIDHRADLFACGVLLYRMLTGRRAFTGATEQVMYKILNEDPPPPSVVTNGARPAAFDAIVARAIAKKPADRYPDAQAMRAALQSISRGAAATSPQATVIVPIPRDGEQRTTTSSVSPSVASPSQPTPPAARDAALTSGTGVTSGATSLGTHWDPAELQRLERALATHVGPMARVMIRDAARTHADATSLATAVGRHIPDEHKRQQFIDLARGSSQVTPVGSPLASGARPLASGARPLGSGATPIPPADPAGDPLTEDFKAHVLQVITRRMGPIARVMVKRAAEAAGGNREQFVDALLHAIPEADRWTVQGEINKLG